MKPHAALIVDDERIARRELAYQLRAFPEIEIVGEAASVDEAVALIERLRPALVFLDIQMPGASGFDLFDRINVDAHVIFVTAYDEFALRAFEVNALDYLTKPVRSQRLQQSIARYLHRVHAEPSPVRRLSLSDSILLTIDHAPRFIKRRFHRVHSGRRRLYAPCFRWWTYRHGAQVDEGVGATPPDAALLPHPALGHHQL